MPNHVRNKLIFSCSEEEMRAIYKKYSTYCENWGHWTRFPDLEKIVPYPDGFLSVDKNEDFDEFSIEKDNLKKILDSLRRSKDKERIKNFIDGIKNYLNTGFFCWYDWNMANWRTKWNTYACETINEFTFSFETAWVGIPKMIQKLSVNCPDVVIDYSCSSEHFGHECVHFVFKNGGIISGGVCEDNSDEALELARMFHPELERRNNERN